MWERKLGFVRGIIDLRFIWIVLFFFFQFLFFSRYSHALDIFHRGDTSKQRRLRLTTIAIAILPQWLRPIWRTDELKQFVKYVFGWSFSYFQFIPSFFCCCGKLKFETFVRIVRRNKFQETWLNGKWMAFCGAVTFVCLPVCLCGGDLLHVRRHDGPP